MRRILLIKLLLSAIIIFAVTGYLGKVFIDSHQVTKQEIQQANTPGPNCDGLGSAHTVPEYKAFLDAGCIDVNRKDYAGNTQLHFFALNPQFYDPKLVDLYVQYGADINAQGPSGKTPLHTAITSNMNGAMEMIKALIKNGANVNVKDGSGRTPLDDIIGQSLYYGYKDTYWERIELLLKSKANPNETDSRGRALLTYSINEKIASVFIKYGANVNIKDNSGNTPLMYLIHDENIVKLLIKHGADITARDNDDNTILMKAAKGGSPKIVELLIQKGCDVNAINKHKDTALDIAFRRKASAEIIDILKKYGALSIAGIEKEMPDNKCPTDKPLRTAGGYGANGAYGFDCVSCDGNWSIPFDPYCESRCPNRTTWLGGLCVLKECPQDTPLRRDNGLCYACDDNRPLVVANSEDCNPVCPNRILEGSYCILKECPEGSIRMERGDCRTCQNFIENPRTTEDCSRCPNLIAWGNNCAPKECPDNWRDKEGRCECESMIYFSLAVDDPDKCVRCGYTAVPAHYAKNRWKCQTKI